jgi:hypothetical protein
MSTLKLQGEGVTIPDFSGTTKWLDIQCSLTVKTIRKQTIFELDGCCISYFQNREYFSLFNTFKVSNDCYLVKNSFDKLTNRLIPESTHIYKITNFNTATQLKTSENLVFEIRSYSERYGNINGQLTLTRKRGFLLD